MPNAYHHVFFIVRDGISDDEVARLRQVTGGFTWAATVRLDGREALDRYIKESPADIRAVNVLDFFTQPPKFMAHDHVDQSA